MITEVYVSFETAILLKEKGFDSEPTRYYRVKDGIIISSRFVKDTEGLRKSDDFDEKYIQAPSQSLALKWLREVHKIVVCISPMQEIDGDCIEWCAEIYKIVGEKGLSLEDEIYWDSYEEAQNEALKYTLENLI